MFGICSGNTTNMSHIMLEISHIDGYLWGFLPTRVWGYGGFISHGGSSKLWVSICTPVLGNVRVSGEYKQHDFDIGLV